MARRSAKERIAGRYFTWLLGIRQGIYAADGRSNSQDVGRHSLGTRDRQEAVRLLAQLDLKKAVEFGLADRSLLDSDPAQWLSLDEGVKRYLAHVQRPPVLGGAGERTRQRYKAVFDKFLKYCREIGVDHWQAVTKGTVEGYGAWLDDEGYAPATEYLELTTIKQVIKWFADEKHIPAACVFVLPLEKPQGTTTYCFRPEEVQAILDHCFKRTDLIWLGQVLLALATTGLRIGELAQLRWSDIDFEHETIRLIDARGRARKADRKTARTTKSGRDRALPIHDQLRTVLERMDRHADAHIFHGPLRGKLKPDTVRNVLIREVLTPLASKFPATDGEKGFRDGRLHSFRHYFCSQCANSGISELVVMTWLGHRDSKMVRHYFHLHQNESRRQMRKVRFVSAPISRKEPR